MDKCEKAIIEAAVIWNKVRGNIAFGSEDSSLTAAVNNYLASQKKVGGIGYNSEPYCQRCGCPLCCCRCDRNKGVEIENISANFANSHQELYYKLNEVIASVNKLNE